MKRLFACGLLVLLGLWGASSALWAADATASEDAANYVMSIRVLRSQMFNAEAASSAVFGDFKPERAQAFASRGIAEAFYFWYFGVMQKVQGLSLRSVYNYIDIARGGEGAVYSEILKYYQKVEERIAESDSRELYKEAAAAVRAGTLAFQGLNYELARDKWREASLCFLLGYVLEDNLDPETWGKYNFVKASEQGKSWWVYIWEDYLPGYAEELRDSGYFRSGFYISEIQEVRPVLTAAYREVLINEASKAFEREDWPRMRRNIVRLMDIKDPISDELQKKCDVAERKYLIELCDIARENRDWLTMRRYARSLFQAIDDLNRPELDRPLGEQLVEEAEREFRQETLEAYNNAMSRHQWELACEKAIALQEVAQELGIQLLKEAQAAWVKELLQQMEEITDPAKLAKILLKIFSMDPENAEARSREGAISEALGGSTFRGDARLDGRSVQAKMSFGGTAVQWETSNPVPGFRYGEKFHLDVTSSQGGMDNEASLDLVFASIGPAAPVEIPLKAGTFTAVLPGGMKLRMMKIPAGSCQIGSPEGNRWHLRDEIQHEVVFPQEFWLGQYEVTQAQWTAVMGTSPSKGGLGDNNPVESISWDEAREFCKRLNESSEISRPKGYVFELPTEAQWEYACRAGTSGDLNNGTNLTNSRSEDSELSRLGWYQSNSLGGTHAVGQKEPNAWGLYDMHGNVWEWCLDRARDYNGWVYSNNYTARKRTEPLGTEGYERLVRGGSWINEGFRLRSAYRMCASPSFVGNGVGFRVALVPAR